MVTPGEISFHFAEHVAACPNVSHAGQRRRHQRHTLDSAAGTAAMAARDTDFIVSLKPAPLAPPPLTKLPLTKVPLKKSAVAACRHCCGSCDLGAVVRVSN